MAVASSRRRLFAGVETHGSEVAHARVWAPACESVDLVLERGGGQEIHSLAREGDGFFSGDVPAHPGDRYWLRLDGDRLRPDPMSRFQPDGPHGSSQIVDPSTFRWSDGGWEGLAPEGQILYEMHVGTFTPEGTWRAAMDELPYLRDLGVTVIEIMPIADFPGQFGWGYDGVNLYAPTRVYGTPDDLRAFVDRAHALGLGVILDVVYNHLGPDGNYLAEFSGDYFTSKYTNDWGMAINFEGPRAARDYFVQNAGYWIEEFHFDGLRLDATQDIHDTSERHVIGEVAARSRQAGGHKPLYLIAENEAQKVQLLAAPERGGWGLDGVWNDDFHHSAAVALLGRREAYYSDYRGTPQELLSASKYGYLYQGQWYAWQKQPRGTSALGLPQHLFIAYLENHDQVANSASGLRLHQRSSPPRHRALTALTLLGPATPLLFQGQEFNASSPFQYFADHNDELRRSIAEGRRTFLEQFPSLQDAAVQDRLPQPGDEATFLRSKLDLSERTTHTEAMALHRDLLQIRRDDDVVSGRMRRLCDGAVISASAFVLRYIGEADAGDRLLIVNLGCDLDTPSIAEPLVAPPPHSAWEIQWSSEAPGYGGSGTPPLGQPGEWLIPGESALLLRSVRQLESEA